MTILNPSLRFLKRRHYCFHPIVSLLLINSAFVCLFKHFLSRWCHASPLATIIWVRNVEKTNKQLHIRSLHNPTDECAHKWAFIFNLLRLNAYAYAMKSSIWLAAGPFIPFLDCLLLQFNLIINASTNNVVIFHLCCARTHLYSPSTETNTHT